MSSPGNGPTIQVPYSKVHSALDQGHLFSDKATLQKYARDHAADPLDESRVDQWIDKHPIISGPLQGIIGGARGLAKTVTGLDKTPATRAETELQMFAAEPGHGWRENAGEAVENIGEFMTGEELLGMLGKTGMVMNTAEKLKTVTNLANIVDKVPMIGKLLKIGASAAKQGTIAGAQTFAKTGDPGAAGTSAAIAGALGPVPDVLAGTGSALKTAVKGTGRDTAAEAAQAAAEANVKAGGTYAQQAQETIRPTLEDINAARKPQTVMMNQPGGAPAVATTREVMPQVNIDHVLNQVHDFTGAADRLTQVSDAGYTRLDELTGGQFRKLNAETAAAQNAVWKGEAGAAELYKAKQAQMDALIDSSGISQEMKSSLKSSFRQSYQLRDFGKIWDRSFNAVPGASQVSMAERGLDGKKLMAGLQQAVKIHGRGAIEEALGPGRLETLEDLARANQTKAQRQAFNAGARNVAKSWLFMQRTAHVAGIGAAAGSLVGHWAEGSLIAGGGAAAVQAYSAVMNALKTNPKIAQNFLFALESGAQAERYGPFIASMIQKTVTEGARERQQEQTQ
jgi:hypothetical protein